MGTVCVGTARMARWLGLALLVVLGAGCTETYFGVTGLERQSDGSVLALVNPGDSEAQWFSQDREGTWQRAPIPDGAITEAESISDFFQSQARETSAERCVDGWCHDDRQGTVIVNEAGKTDALELWRAEDQPGYLVAWLFGSDKNKKPFVHDMAWQSNVDGPPTLVIAMGEVGLATWQPQGQIQFHEVAGFNQPGRFSLVFQDAQWIFILLGPLMILAAAVLVYFFESMQRSELQQRQVASTELRPRLLMTAIVIPSWVGAIFGGWAGNRLAPGAAIVIALATAVVLARVIVGLAEFVRQRSTADGPTAENTRASLAFFGKPLFVGLLGFAVALLAMAMLGAHGLAGFGRGGTPFGQILALLFLLGPPLVAYIVVARTRPGLNASL